MNQTRRSYTKEQFLEAVQNNFTIASTMKSLGLSPFGAAYRSFKRAAEEFNADYSHFTGQAHSKNKQFESKKPLCIYLSNEKFITSYKLKKRLLKEGYFEYRCSCCSLDKWLGSPIPLQLDHIDGNPENNHLSNLRLLCPNCHALTPTYCGKNTKRNKKRDTDQ